MEEITRLQDHLPLIRMAVGWTAEELGERIGVTRQTISNIENGRNKLTKTQYIAIRSVLDAEMAQSPEEDSGMLRLLLEVLVDHPDDYSEEEYNKVLDDANMLVPSILAGTSSRRMVSKKMLKDIGVLAGLSVSALLGTIGIAAGLNSWLAKAVASGRIRPKGK